MLSFTWWQKLCLVLLSKISPISCASPQAKKDTTEREEMAAESVTRTEEEKTSFGGNLHLSDVINVGFVQISRGLAL